jgi:hypothetical protein
MAEAGVTQTSKHPGERPKLENVLVVWRLQCDWVAADPAVDGAGAGADASIQDALAHGEDVT